MNQQSEWISVKERLPENGQVVLAYSNFWKEETRMCTNYYTDGEFVTYPAFEKTINVTHWQPLPAPPNQQVVSIAERLNISQELTAFGKYHLVDGDKVMYNTQFDEYEARKPEYADYAKTISAAWRAWLYAKIDMR